MTSQASVTRVADGILRCEPLHLELPVAEILPE